MSLLDDIRSDLVNESADLPNTLRKAKILASAIGLPEFREWIDFELSGYTDADKVPGYRRFCPTNLGTYSGPGQSGIKNVVLPTYGLPVEVKDFAENQIFFEGVGSLQALASDAHQVKWPQEMVMLSRDALQMSGGMVLVDAHQPISGHVISGILDQVKNKLLDFLLDLEASNITPEDLNNHAFAPDVVRNLFNINIYGDSNFVASGENVKQRVNKVQERDIDSLVSFLRELNIERDDLSEIEEAVSAEPDAPDGQYGPKVRTWLGGMISKSASRAWNMGLDAASKVLTNALNDYYGNTQLS